MPLFPMPVVYDINFKKNATTYMTLTFTSMWWHWTNRE